MKIEGGSYKRWEKRATCKLLISRLGKPEASSSKRGTKNLHKKTAGIDGVEAKCWKKR